MTLRSKAKWLCIGGLAIALLAINVIAIGVDRRATQYLEAIRIETKNQREYGHQRDRLQIQMAAFQVPEMTAALQQTVESSEINDVLLTPIGQRRWRDDSFYLYAPDDLQEVVVKIRVTDNPTSMNPVDKGAPTRLIQLPLKAGELHELSVGFPENYDRFRVDWDGQQLYSLDWGRGRSGSSSSFTTEGHFGLIQASTLQRRYPGYDSVLQSGVWRRLSSKSFTSGTGQQRQQIGFTIELRTDGPMFVSERLYLDARAKLNLRWDPELKRHRILSLKESP